METRHLRFVRALLLSDTVAEAAEASGIGLRTAFRWLSRDAVREALHAAQDAAMLQTVMRISDDSAVARKALRAIVESGRSESARVSAARVLLLAGIQLREELTLVQRIERLEGLLHENE